MTFQVSPVYCWGPILNFQGRASEYRIVYWWILYGLWRWLWKAFQVEMNLGEGINIWIIKSSVDTRSSEIWENYTNRCHEARIKKIIFFFHSDSYSYRSNFDFWVSKTFSSFFSCTTSRFESHIIKYSPHFLYKSISSSCPWCLTR